MADFIYCGLLSVNADPSPIVCDPSTGDLVLVDDILGNSILSNLSIVDPIPMDESVLRKLLTQVDGCGVIMSSTYMIVLKEDKAEYHSFADMSKIEHVVDYDYDTVYDGEVLF